MDFFSLKRQTEVVTCIAQLKSLIVSTQFNTTAYFSLVMCTEQKRTTQINGWQRATKQTKVASSFLIHSNLPFTSPEKVVAHHVYVWTNDMLLSLCLLFIPIAQNNFKVLIYFKISYLIYAELFFSGPSSSSSFPFCFSILNLVFLSTEFAMMEWRFLIFSMSTLHAIEIAQQNYSIHGSIEKPTKFLVRSFVS